MRIGTSPRDALDDAHDVGHRPRGGMQSTTRTTPLGGVELGLEDERAVAVAARDAARRAAPGAISQRRGRRRRAARRSRRRVEARQAQPVDRAVAADQRRGLRVADQRVVLDAGRHGRPRIHGRHRVSARKPGAPRALRAGLATGVGPYYGGRLGMRLAVDKRLRGAAWMVCMALLAGACEQPAQPRPRPKAEPAAPADGLIATEVVPRWSGVCARAGGRARWSTCGRVGVARAQARAAAADRNGERARERRPRPDARDRGRARRPQGRRRATRQARLPRANVHRRRPHDAVQHALNPAWKGAIPSTFLFDAEGTLRYFWPGPVLEQEIEPISCRRSSRGNRSRGRRAIR